MPFIYYFSYIFILKIHGASIPPALQMSRLPWRGWSKWALSSGLASGPDTFCPTALPLEGIAQFSHSVVSDSLQPHGLQHVRLFCPSPTQRVCSNSCPLSWWCYTTVSSSVVPLPSCLQSFPASGWFPMSQFFTSGGQSTKASTSASIPPVNIQDSNESVLCIRWPKY